MRLVERKKIRLRAKWQWDQLAPLCLIAACLPYLFTIFVEERKLNTLFHLTLETTKGKLKPLPVQPHLEGKYNTTSKEWPLEKMKLPRYRLLLANVTQSLAYYLEKQSLHCLCMHHLQKTVKSNFRVCATHLEGTHETIYLVNPTPKGLSKEGLLYEEQSLACGANKKLQSKRAQLLLLDWYTVDGLKVAGAFYQGRAACFQLVLEEMAGTVKCN